MLGAALLLVALNAVKPLHIDDPFSQRIAEQITRHPADPYGFDILWVQWPQPVHEELTPPVVPYWWALGIALFGRSVVAWKVWFAPFVLLFALSLHTLLRRLARGTELPLTLFLLFSPAVLPAVNLMQDIPAQALALAALALYLVAHDRSSLVVAAGSGLALGLAMQTKYTAVSVLAVVLVHGGLHRRFRAALVAVGCALAVFAAWEGLTTIRYGTGMFLGQLGSPLWEMHRSAMIVPLLRLVGGTVPILAVIGLAGLGLPTRATLVAAAGVLAAYSVLWFAPVENLIYPAFGAGCWLSLAAIAARLTRLDRGARRPPWTARRLDWLLVSWLLVEIVVYFGSAPFPAVRRVLGVTIAATFVVGRLVALRLRSRTPRVPLAALAALGAGLGLAFWLVDLREALAQRDAPRVALRAIRELDPEPTIWYVGHWGFQYYAEEAALAPVVPDVSRLGAGHWLVIPDRVHQQEILLGPADASTETRLTLDDGIPLATGQGFYGGDTPLAHHAGPRLSLTILRLRRDVVPVTAWSPSEIYRWARYAPPESAAAALPALRRLLRAETGATRGLAAKGLAALGPRARAAMLDLCDASRDPETAVRLEAVRALGRIGDDSVASEITARLGDPAPEVRDAAREALDRISPVPR